MHLMPDLLYIHTVCTGPFIMTITLLGAPAGGTEPLPLYSFHVPAGFPSPAADHLEGHISLDELFDLRAPHVYLVKVEGDSMQGAGIYSGDIVIVDRGREAGHGDVVIAAVNSEPVCKRLYRRDGVVILKSENPAYPPRYVMEGDELVIWGVVRYSVRDHAQ
ncbi:DNA polymerase V [Pseudomonas putida]|uniref:Peptidase S24, S26A and S26B n=3 Tax=Pseudomonas TaxID=286 RepID=A0A1L7NFH4_PSEPU|nr:DNA polymerase V [Pseudomonas sp. PvP089]MBP2091822.1 DNA polymerase V [Pseudomonas sp. PvP088]MBP2222015.1 DNA polymerase V [Pseudomonas putida]BAW24217.1 peptidase S24, S26A and S26B [Pseudomonas putida]GLO20039.1 peptidase S24 [Pseudomonas putida]